MPEWAVIQAMWQKLSGGGDRYLHRFEHPLPVNDALKTLDVGCGGKKARGAVGIDRLDIPGVDIIHDLNVFPYPFKDDEFDRIILDNCLEHLNEPLDVLAELHRVARDDALVHIIVPHYSSCDYFTDPTHRHAFSSRSFDYLIPGTRLARYRYAEATPFAKQSVRIVVATGIATLDRLAESVINRFMHPYELRLAWIFPASQIVADLRVVKPRSK